MPKYLIERDVPGIGNFTERDRQAMALKSNHVLHEMNNGIQWQHSYVSDDKLYCVYIADDVSLVRDHAERGEFPVSHIYPVNNMMDPTTAE